MGNNHPFYYNQAQATAIIGPAVWARLSRILNQACGRYIDHHFFSKILALQFDHMPQMLLDCLYQACAADIYTKVEVSTFISALAAAIGRDREALMKFLFRVYDVSLRGEIDRFKMEKCLVSAYGNMLDKSVAIFQLNSLFGSRKLLSLLDFESYKGAIDVFSGWVQTVLIVFVEAAPIKLMSLERKYSLALESEEMMTRYGVPKTTCDQLRELYYSKCVTNTRPELDLTAWLMWTASYIPKRLARELFLIKTTLVSSIWRFADFSEFCMKFGVASIEEKASYLCTSYYEYHVQRPKVIDVLSPAVPPDGGGEAADCVCKMRQLLGLLSIMDLDGAFDNGDSEQFIIPQSLEVQIAEVERAVGGDPRGGWLQLYMQLLCRNYDELPGLRYLSVTACCLFGIRPLHPWIEKDFITELQLRRQAIAAQNSRLPYGPVNTKWCIICSSWWNAWRMYVGRAQKAFTASVLEDDPSMSTHHQYDSPPLPPIDNWTILKKGVKINQILSGSILGHQFEAIAPSVFDALQSWYGGGPKIVRYVTQPPQNSKDSRPYLELYPLCLRVCLCDGGGKLRKNSLREILVSQYSKVGTVIEEVCSAIGVSDVAKGRLWNYENSHWKKQFILSPEVTLQEANLQDGQNLLLELSSADGSWPRSQLQAQLEIDELQSTSDGKSVGEKSPQALSPHASNISHGRLGLENLGNTCYLNSSLQLLCHMTPFVEYFLGGYYLREVNSQSKHGYQGRLVSAFGRLLFEIWVQRDSTSSYSGGVAMGMIRGSRTSITPVKFRRLVGTLSEQFSHDDQQDAQELLAFILDGLCEELNLVSNKPYIEHPDSDDRPDKVLADIWWDNHLKRELSVVQTLFTGQFKSVMRCRLCSYTSARFEAFNFLTLPLPDEEERLLSVHVVPRGAKKATLCSVLVKKVETLQAVAAVIRKYNLGVEGSDCTLVDAQFVVLELSLSKLTGLYTLNKKVDSIRDGDNLFFYEVLQENTTALEASGDVIPTALLPSTDEDGEDKASDPANEVDHQSEVGGGDHEVKSSKKGSKHRPIIFMHRRVCFSAGAGVELFRMETVGLPIVEVLPKVIKGSDLYKIVSERTSVYLKCELNQFVALSNLSRSKSDGETDEDVLSASLTSSQSIHPLRLEDAVAQDIPTLVKPSGDFCSRCHWLTRCDGCAIPDNDCEVELQNGVTIAIDWHYKVFQEILDLYSATQLIMHSSVKQYQDYHTRVLDLSKCLDKFTEEELLDDMVCPKCKEDHCLKKTLTIWRLPLLLLIQLKRFQYNNYSRRKLTNLVDFPLEGLNLSSFVSSSQSLAKEGSKSSDGNAVDLVNEEGDASKSKDLTDVYDLTGVVHHVGAMGGGHYDCTVRDDSAMLRWLLTSKERATAQVEEQDLPPPVENKWWCYNDGVVSAACEDEVKSASAYILCYSHRGMRGKNVWKLHEEFVLAHSDRIGEPPLVRQEVEESKGMPEVGGVPYRLEMEINDTPKLTPDSRDKGKMDSSRSNYNADSMTMIDGTAQCVIS